MPTISALIITMNEERNIDECLKSVSWADEIVVVDSGSVDKTVEKAQKYTDKVYMNGFKDFSTQKNFCLSKSSCEWVLFIDADERVTEMLRRNIVQSINSSGNMNGYYIKRLTYIFGRLMRGGGHDSDYPLRLFKKDAASFTQPVHEMITIPNLKSGRIDEPMLHYSTRNMADYVNKMNFYTEFEAHFMADRGLKMSRWEMVSKPACRFLQRYILQRGFRDGFEGYLFYTLSSFYDFVKYSKCWELTRSVDKKDGLA